MKNDSFSKLVERAISVKLKAIDHLLDTMIEPLAKVGAPEDLIGKPYEQWTPEDLQLLTSIYGTADNTPLSNLVFKKTYKRILDLEAEEV